MKSNTCLGRFIHTIARNLARDSICGRWSFLALLIDRRAGVDAAMRGSTVFAVEHVADDAAALGVGFGLVFAFDGIFGACRLGLIAFRLAARGAAIGEAGLAGTQLELLAADDASLDREGHNAYMLANIVGRRRARMEL